MKQLKLLGLALIAVFALGVVAAATASAAEKSGILFLEKESAPVSFTINGGAGTLASGLNEIACTAVTGEATSRSGETEHVTLGTGDLHFTGCKLTKGKSKVACNTSGDSKEVILVLADFHIFDSLNEDGVTLEAGIAVIILNPPLVVECGGGTTFVDVKGAALGLILCLPGENCLSEDDEGIEDVTVHFSSTGEKCDTATASTYCKEILEKEPLEANFTGKFEKATETTEATMALKKGPGEPVMFFVDD